MPVIRKPSACYCRNLRRAATAVSGMYDAMLQPVGLSVNQFSLLTNAERLGTCCVSELAEFVGQERTTLVRTLQPLLDRGLLEDCSEGGRGRALRVTDDGRRLLERGRPLWESAQEKIAQKLGQENVQIFYDLLAKLLD